MKNKTMALPKMWMPLVDSRVASLGMNRSEYIRACLAHLTKLMPLFPENQRIKGYNMQVITAYVKDVHVRTMKRAEYVSEGEAVRFAILLDLMRAQLDLELPPVPTPPIAPHQPPRLPGAIPQMIDGSIYYLKQTIEGDRW